MYQINVYLTVHLSNTDIREIFNTYISYWLWLPEAGRQAGKGMQRLSGILTFCV
jgi:hypothetical protein